MLQVSEFSKVIDTEGLHFFLTVYLLYGIGFGLNSMMKVENIYLTLTT